jgi:hypothetical protein
LSIHFNGWILANLMLNLKIIHHILFCSKIRIRT